MTVYTVGHSSRTLEELVGILRNVPGESVSTLVDIRRFPRSRTNPQFDAERLAPALAAAGITYGAFPALGGRRGRKDAGGGGEAALARQGGWEVEAFRAYAAYATTPAFRQAFGELVSLALAQEERGACALMCAEALWWRCHRRIVTDYLIAAGFRVRHLMGAGVVQEASLTPFARPGEDGTLLYPAT